MKRALLIGLLFVGGCSEQSPEPDGIVRFHIKQSEDGCSGDVTATIREGGVYRTVTKRVTPEDPWCCGIDCSPAFWACGETGEVK